VSVCRKTGQADEDLIALYMQGHDMFGSRRADRYLDDLEALFERLAEHPGLARLRTEFEPPVRAFTYRAHVVIYEEEPGGIVIVRVRHGHEDWHNDPRGPRDDRDQF